MFQRKMFWYIYKIIIIILFSLKIVKHFFILLQWKLTNTLAQEKEMDNWKARKTVICLSRKPIP